MEASDRDAKSLDTEPPRVFESDSKPPAIPSPERGPRPPVPRRGTGGYNSITDYGHYQLVSLVRWIESDTLLRTDEDVMREMLVELGFRRSGSRIRAAIGRAIKDARH